MRPLGNKKIRFLLNEIFDFLTNRQFIYNLLGIVAFLAIVLIGVFTWLRMYTHHGQKLELPNYVDQPLTFAETDALARTFEIIVNDSVHIVGKDGGIVQNQNPPGGSFVKEKRKIYVTITKYQPDKVDLSEMVFFGEDYEQVKRTLQGKSITSEIKSYEFDPLTQNSVLEVWHNGRLKVSRSEDPDVFEINKGDVLEFVVSSAQGGVSEVPLLVGKTVGTADFIVTGEGLVLELQYLNDLGIDDTENAIVVEQDPEAGTTLPRGSTITVKIKAP